MVIFAIHLMGVSSIMGAINIIVDDPEHARAGHDAAEDAAVRVDLADHRVPADRGDAGARGRGDDAADRPLLRHQLLHRRGRRRPGDVPAHLLVLRPPRGLHPDPAGVRHRLGDHPDLLAQAAVRLRGDGVRDRVDRVPVVHRLGAPHVHGRHAARRRAVLHVLDDADRDPDRREGVQLDARRCGRAR